ncbi:MAG: rhomboid family intramembrane serine protease [Gemmatimonadales bacterium]
MTAWVLRLLVANAAVYLLIPQNSPLYQELVLVPIELLRYPWTIVTYMFLHGGFGHILFNMITLFFFGPRVEERLGGRRFLLLYFISGIMGGLLSLVFMPRVGIVGASGAIFGVSLAFARFWPRARIYIWGVLPIEARWLVIIMTGLSLFGGFIPSAGGGIAHFAHLGGFLGGFLYLKYLEVTSGARRFRAKAAAVPRASNPGTRDLKRWSQIPREGLHEVNRTEVERLLQKIQSTGIDSLTPAERETLDRFAPPVN